MIPFFRLIRISNLLILVTMMLIMGAYIDWVYELNEVNQNEVFALDFILLIFSVVLVAASGNIINDVYDVETDEVNRPAKVVIGNTIKRKNALYLYFLFVGIAMVLAIYLSVKYHTFLYLIVHSLTIVLLWIYSFRLKKVLVLGNIIVAFLIGLVPVLVGVYYWDIVHLFSVINPYPFQLKEYDYFPVYLGIGFGFFAFLTNWVREIVKDMEDVEGDHIINARTIPIIFGMQKSRSVVYFLILILLVFTAAALYFRYHWNMKLMHLIPLFLCFLSFLTASIVLAYPITQRRLKSIDLYLKISMVFGILLPLFWMCF